MKKHLVFIISLISFSVYSQKVGIYDLKKVAQKVVDERYGADWILCQSPQPIVYQGDTTMYVFSFTNKNGYILLSTEKNVFPLLSYSKEANFDLESNNLFLQKFVEERAKQIHNVRMLKTYDEEAVKEWNYYLSNLKIEKSTKSVPPLLKTRWAQGCYYNAMCPEDPVATENCGRAVTGCVATAMGQIMYYYKHPRNGKGSNQYSHPKYGIIKADFENTTYNYDAMEPYLTTYNDEVAKLLFHCGVSVNMYYGPVESGSNTLASEFALKEYFRYEKYAQVQEKKYFSDSMWEELLRNELLSDRPILYRGFGTDGGHAFICDGFEKDRHFHFDFGWGGKSNGYFYLTNLNGFTKDQAAIFGVEPQTDEKQYCQSLVTLKEPQGTITDGSADKAYTNNTSCKWLINPDDAGAIVIEFKSLRTEKDVDFVKIIKGTSENGELVYQISGFNIPENPIVVEGNAALIVFNSDEYNRGPGWELSYTTWGTNIEKLHDKELKINVDNEKLIVNSGNFAMKKIQIFSLLGSLVKEIDLDDAKEQVINIESFSSGCYFVKVLYKNDVTVAKKLFF